MAAPTRRMQRAMERLESRRRIAEGRIQDIRRSLDRETGWMPKTKAWIVPLVAFAIGLAVASRQRRRSDVESRRADAATR